MLTPDQDYTQERTCTYKDETYSVRDNGAVMRHSKEGNRKRKNDNTWTFGRQNPRNGYMYIGQVRIHQIVATAFHGEPANKYLVVDHKDSNKCNNRPENLHWVTRLENALNNPTTRWKIELRCGSIEAFLENPSILNDYVDDDPNFSWMRTVSKEEGQRTLENMENWAKKRQVPSGTGTMGEWIYSANIARTDEAKGWQQNNMSQTPALRNTADTLKSDAALEEYFSKILSEENEEKKESRQSDIQDTCEVEERPPLIPEAPDTIPSLTPNARQRQWKTETEFPCCPTEPDATLEDYYANLRSGCVFTRNNYNETTLVDFAQVNDSILVFTQSPKETSVKPWYLCRIVKEEGLFIHENLGSFFEEQGARKQFTLQQGLEWTCGDSIDDYC